MKKFLLFIAFAVVPLINASQEDKPLSEQWWQIVKSKGSTKSQACSFAKGAFISSGIIGGSLSFLPPTWFNTQFQGGMLGIISSCSICSIGLALGDKNIGVLGVGSLLGAVGGPVFYIIGQIIRKR